MGGENPPTIVNSDRGALLPDFVVEIETKIVNHLGDLEILVVVYLIYSWIDLVRY